MKNIDVIKSMSIEEMGDWLESVVEDVVTELEKSADIVFKTKINYAWHLKQWLISEVEDGK